MLRAVAILALLMEFLASVGCGRVSANKNDAGESFDAKDHDGGADPPQMLAITASPASFILHANDTRETTITITNGTTEVVGTPTLQVVGLTLGTITFGSNACASSLEPGTSCTAMGTLTATTTGEVDFMIAATTTPGGTAMTSLSATVMPACPATCGAGGTTNCCASSVVSGNANGAPFYRSYDVASDGMFPDMGFPANVGDFRLDKYEVTVGRFRAFVNAGFGTQAKPPAAGAGARPLNGMPGQGGWDPIWNTNLAADTTSLAGALKCASTFQTWTDTAGTNESVPINCVSWYEAMAFCVWDGGFLPTEAEWNYAAAGGSEQRAYPWSSPASSTAIDCSYANYLVDNPPGMACVNGTTGAANRVGSESPKGDGKWGQSDLGGNISEWTLDFYATPYPAAACDNCANLTVGTMRTHRGGSLRGNAQFLRTSWRFANAPTGRSYNFGFRCARKP